MQHTESFQRVICWKPSRISEVINTEAVSVDRADFLATHTPLSRIRYLHAPQAIPDTSEERLLYELWDRTDTDAHTFMVVQGIPGTGKSHLIRWLKERYVAKQQEHGDRDVVLLIERVHNSLRGTLQQLINSSAFDERTMHEQLEKLRGAADELSSVGLADTLLNNLQVATHEITLREADMPGPRIRKNIEKFLLDYTVRKALKEPQGPIDRIVRFLSEGTYGGNRADEQPGFEPRDFHFDVAVLKHISGYEEARRLADALALTEELREDLARYLNRLLRFAIGRTMALSAEDLKRMFFDLRRELRSQGRSLVLFVEDITAFTGIDAGLIDVLATQHTGEENRALCRLISVIGITDGYFADHFPDNMKDRVTHQLTLSADEQGRKVSDSLQNPDVVIDVAARYLNAMRLDRQTFAAWADDGGQSDALPNACSSCRYQQPCHAAFGAKMPDGEDAEARLAIGLYPFNRQALVTMYQRLDSSVVSHTPRSLLNSVLEYVVQSHGPKIKEGRFPPPPHLVGSHVKAPELVKPVQRQTIDNQAGAEAERVRSLILFWGDRTVDRSQDTSGRRLVGGLPAGVFQAFGLPFIEGSVSGSASVAAPPEGNPPLSKQPDRPPQGGAAPNTIDRVPPAAPTEGNRSPTPGAALGRSQRQRDLAQNISEWSAGEQLREHETLREYLERYIQSAIDWEMHGIAVFQWQDRCIRRRIHIEHQAGKMNVNDYITFERSAELGYVLQALVDLNGEGPVEPATLGAHLATLSRWLGHEEARIIEYVRSPGRGIPEPRPLVEVLLIDCLLLEWLSGSLRIRDKVTDSLKDLIGQCAAAQKDSSSTVRGWNSACDQAKTVRSQLWNDLMGRFGQRQAQRVIDCRARLLELLNRTQGVSKNVRFIDAATALDILRAFDADRWALPQIVVTNDDISAPAWLSGVEVYSAFQEHLPQVLANERMLIRQRLDQVDRLLGGASVAACIEAITRTLAKLKEHNYYFAAEVENPPQSATTISRHKNSLVDVTEQREPRTTALKLSAAMEDIVSIQRFTAYLESFKKLAELRLEKATTRIAQLENDGVNVDIHQAAERAFTAIERMLESTIASSIGQENKQ